MSGETLSISDYLKYANLQMAAEAFILDPDTGLFNGSGDALEKALFIGNKHDSVFTDQQASDFKDNWVAVDQSANTSTGFTGTLFKCIKDDPATGAKAGDLVISFRSTEFIDDAVRDNEATNSLEIKDFGFAFGQISDMQAWYKQLQDSGEIGVNDQISLTGYSLGGHLATAFNMLYGSDTTAGGQPRIQQVVTFNGAGVGTVAPTTTLAQVMSNFEALRGDYDPAIHDDMLRALYDRTRSAVAAGGTISSGDEQTLRGMLTRVGGELPVDADTEPVQIFV
jgi:hypothetical protein